MTASRMRSRLGRWLVGLVLASAAGCTATVTPDLIITNARVFTNDTARPWAEAVAIKGERIVAVGAARAVLATAGAATRVIDAGGRAVVPGFNDARVDLPLEPPTPATLTALDQRAIARGVTSLQVVAGGPMRSLVVAAQQATRQARWRLIRSPEDTATLSTTDPRAIVRQDERPFLPPQPGLRLAANGVAWRLGSDRHGDRRALDPSRVGVVVGWSYGAEDPIVMTGAAGQWAAGLARVGLTEVWRRKRPRLDVLGLVDYADVQRLASRGVGVVWTTAVVRGIAAGPQPFGIRPLFPGSLSDAGAWLALGSAGEPGGAAVVAAATGATTDRGVGGR